MTPRHSFSRGCRPTWRVPVRRLAVWLDENCYDATLVMCVLIVLAAVPQ
jgi:hypothetical protein